jgi:Squalene-hopene cyclase C-terminal domain
LRELWLVPEVTRILRTQKGSGAWGYHGGSKRIRSRNDYDQLETFRVVRELVEKYGFNNENEALTMAAEFLFSCQTKEGDFRGIAGNQYVPYYSAAIMELLIKAGYHNDPRIEKGFKWLTSVRQRDGGWAFPLRTGGGKLDWSRTLRSSTIEPDLSKPFSHLVTGMVLRAFAAHPIHRKSEEAKVAGELLASRFFQADKYSDRRSPSFWTTFSYPFWFTDLLSSLDSLSMLGFDRNHPQIRKGLEWFSDRQEKTGVWKLSLRIMAGEKEPDLWISLAICRVFERFYT